MAGIPIVALYFLLRKNPTVRRFLYAAKYWWEQKRSDERLAEALKSRQRMLDKERQREDREEEERTERRVIDATVKAVLPDPDERCHRTDNSQEH